MSAPQARSVLHVVLIFLPSFIFPPGDRAEDEERKTCTENTATGSSGFCVKSKVFLDNERCASESRRERSSMAETSGWMPSSARRPSWIRIQWSVCRISPSSLKVAEQITQPYPHSLCRSTEEVPPVCINKQWILSALG